MNGQLELAGCVILDEYDRILLLHRRAAQNSWWELPGGKIEKGETAEAAAIREVNEEVGLQVRLIKTLGSATFEDSTATYNYQWFQAVIEKNSPSLMETGKFDDLDYFDSEDLMSLALSPNMEILYEKITSGEVVLT